MNSITAGGAAEKAGLQRGDVITSVNGNPVKDTNSLRNEVSEMMPGTDVKVALLRDGKEQTVAVRLGEAQGSRAQREDGRRSGSSNGYGLSVEPLTRDTARQLGVGISTGLVVTGIEPSSRASDGHCTTLR